MKTQRFMLLSNSPLEVFVGLDELTDPDFRISWPTRCRPNRLWASALAKPRIIQALAGLPPRAEVHVYPGRMKILVPGADHHRPTIERVLDAAHLIADALAEAALGTGATSGATRFKKNGTR